MGLDAPFRSRRRGIEVRLGSAEIELLVHLLQQLDDLLDDADGPEPDPAPAGGDEFAELAALTGLDGLDGPERQQPPADPALARLLPDAHRDDPELAGEFRRLTEAGLRARKRSGARLAAEALGRPKPTLESGEAQALLKALTDLRLVLGERLGLRTDDDADALTRELFAAGGADSPRAAAVLTYDVLTSWQEALVGALSKQR